jgi:hypothetical protein
MKRLKCIVRGSFWAFSIVAIILLAPSSGLVTLTVPDEPYGTIVGLPDMPHIGKRASDNPKHLTVDAAFTTYELRPKLSVLDDATRLSRNSFCMIVVLQAQIRAPPNVRVV